MCDEKGFGGTVEWGWGMSPETANFLIAKYEIISAHNRRVNEYRWNSAHFFMLSTGALFVALFAKQISVDLYTIRLIIFGPAMFCLVNVLMEFIMNAGLKQRNALLDQIDGLFEGNPPDSGLHGATIDASHLHYALLIYWSCALLVTAALGWLLAWR